MECDAGTLSDALMLSAALRDTDTPRTSETRHV